MAQRLYVLLEELTKGGLSGSRVRRQFHDSPESLTADLPPEARKALYTMDHAGNGAICAFVEQEFKAEGIGDQFPTWRDWFVNWQFPQTEFVPEDKLPADCQYEGGAYPDPKPLVYDIDPNPLSWSDPGTTDPTEIMISGQGFVAGRTRVELKMGNTLLTLTPKYSGMEGSYRCGHLYYDMKLPPQPGADEDYEIRVFVTTGGKDGAGNPIELGPLTVRDDGSGNPIVFTLKP